MSQNRVIVIASLLFILVSIFLFWKNERELDPNSGKNFWNISFDSPDRPESLEFTIENYTDDVDFNYVVTENLRVIEKNDVKVERTRKAMIRPLLTAALGTPTTVTVTHGKEQKEIYRK